MKIIETRHMSMDSLRSLCIQYGWFTKGDCKAYDNFLNLSGNCKKDITATNIYEMAKTIENYSSASSIERMDTASIMFSLAQICYTTFEIKED